MGKIVFNQKSLKKTRKKLRNNMTDTEIKLWNFLKGKQINGYKFRRQHSVGRYILDFYCPKINLCIEIDGNIHDNTKEYDKIITDYLNQIGIKVLRFANDEILYKIDNVIDSILKYSPPAREGLGVG